MRTSRRGRGEGTIGRRTDGIWWARVDLGYVDGKRRRKAIYGKMRASVAGRLTKLLRDVQQGLPVPLERQTVGQFLEHWLEHSVRLRVRPRTYTSYEQTIRLHIAPNLGRVRLQHLAPQQVQEWMNALQNAGASAQSCRYARAILRAALAQALRWGIVSRNVATLVAAPRASQPQIRPLDGEQARAFLAAVSGHRLEALFSAAVALGLRQGEALGLRWEDVDVAGSLLHVRRALQRVGGNDSERRRLATERKGLKADLLKASEPATRERLTKELRRVWDEMRGVCRVFGFVEPKSTRSRRVVSLPAVVTSALKSHRIRQLEERLAAGQRWRESGLVFTTRSGTPLDPRNIVREFHAILRRAELPSIRFHDLRHTAATLLLAQGVGPRTIMETLGHSQISLTLGTYSHILPALQEEAAAKMDAVLRGQ